MHISDAVEGLLWIEGLRDWRVEGVLKEKVREWQKEEKKERGEEGRRTKEMGSRCYGHR